MNDMGRDTLIKRTSIVSFRCPPWARNSDTCSGRRNLRANLNAPSKRNSISARVSVHVGADPIRINRFAWFLMSTREYWFAHSNLSEGKPICTSDSHLGKTRLRIFSSVNSNKFTFNSVPIENKSTGNRRTTRIYADVVPRDGRKKEKKENSTNGKML